jgi:hypothetical protein
MYLGCRTDPQPLLQTDQDLLTAEAAEENEIGEGEEGLPEAGPEIELEYDPFESSPSGPDENWVQMIRSIKPREPEFPSADEQRARIRELLQVLDTEPPEPTESQVAEASNLLKNLDSIIPNHEKFVASGFSHCYPAWHELLKGVGRKSARTVLGWVKNGFRPKFVGTAAAKPAKRKAVVAMLAKIVPGREIPGLLRGKLPHQVEFQNHRSLYRKWGFSSEQIVKLLEADAAGIWEKPEPPIIIHPMGVVDSAGKDRMIVNGRYLNLFLEALPSRYERLRDILAFTKKGSFMATWDLKSGYFDLPIHKDFQKYFGFRVGGLTFYFKVLCFGFAQACYVFTKLMQEPTIELRKRGFPISDYIDDSFTAARTRARCLRQSVISILLFAALGAFMGLPKCNLDPLLLQKWLGFLVDSEDESFRVGESKIQKLKQLLEETIARPQTSVRKIAEIAGKILAVSPAVLPAALYSRGFYSALKGKSSWDEIFPTPSSVKEAAEFWLRNIDRFNGRKWWPQPMTVRATVDASGVGYGGTVSVGEHSPVNSRAPSLQSKLLSLARRARSVGMRQH